MSNFDDVGEFMKACDRDLFTEPTWPSEDVIKLRIDLIQEEFNEFKDAIAAKDMVEVADALSDLLYVVYGSGHSFGIDLDLCFKEVHRSNCTKIVDGKVIKNSRGKIMKPENYSPPNFEEILYGKANCRTD